jgi:hypothetical protein
MGYIECPFNQVLLRMNMVENRSFSFTSSESVSHRILAINKKFYGMLGKFRLWPYANYI